MTLTDDQGLQLDIAYFNCPEVHNPEFTEDEHAAAEIGFEAGYKAALSAQPAKTSAWPRKEGEYCNYPDCNCPFDATADPNWCARGWPHKPAITVERTLELARTICPIVNHRWLADEGDILKLAALIAAEGKVK